MSLLLSVLWEFERLNLFFASSWYFFAIYLTMIFYLLWLSPSKPVPISKSFLPPKSPLFVRLSERPWCFSVLRVFCFIRSSNRWAGPVFFWFFKGWSHFPQQWKFQFWWLLYQISIEYCRTKFNDNVSLNFLTLSELCLPFLWECWAIPSSSCTLNWFVSVFVRTRFSDAVQYWNYHVPFRNPFDWQLIAVGHCTDEHQFITYFFGHSLFLLLFPVVKVRVSVLVQSTVYRTDLEVACKGDRPQLRTESFTSFLVMTFLELYQAITCKGCFVFSSFKNINCFLSYYLNKG